MPAALITGCSSARGIAVAVALAEAGHQVVAATPTPRSLVELEDIPGAVVEGYDSGDPASRADLVARALGHLGRIDVLVNDGGFSLFGPAEEIPGEIIRRHFETNFFAPFGLIRDVLPSMIANGSGRVVNVSSAAAVASAPYFGPYCASQRALDGIAMSLDNELRPFGIRVITVIAGGVEGDLTAERPPAGRPGSRYPQPGDILATYDDRFPDRPDAASVTQAVLAAALDSEPEPRVATSELGDLFGDVLAADAKLHTAMGSWFD
jgi:NAD(P)-dependent dehydrogenase (short-subunit alcohol dehydrogenase family)